MEITAELIPAWLVSVFMILTGLTWFISRTRKIRMDSRGFAITFVLEGIVYALFNIYNVDIQIRGFFVRLMLILLCLSQSLPIIVSTFRSIKRDELE
jgi:hypothetical protein